MTTKDNEQKNQNIFKQTDDTVEYAIVEERLLQVMTRHKQIFIDKNDTASCEITAFPHEVFDKEYQLTDISNDFDKYLSKHKNDYSYLETFYNKITKDGECDVATCTSIARNTRSGKSNRSSYKHTNIGDEEIVCHKLLDNIHIHMFHTFDMGYKLLKKEKQFLIVDDNKDDEKINIEEIDSKLFEIVKSKSKTYHKIRTEDCIDVDDKYNRFSTTVASFTFRDCMINHLLSILSNSEKINKYNLQKNRNNINSLHTWMIEQEFDTDAIQDDIGGDVLNIQCKLADDQYYKDLAEYFDNHNSCPPLYSFGVRYYYWKCFENNENESNLEILKEKKKSWYDRGNTGYKYSDWYVTPKHKNLKDEILHNKLETLPLSGYQRALGLANKKIGERFCKRRRANEYWENIYGIKFRSGMGFNHVLVLVMYCDYDALCSTFSSTYRKLGYHETDQSMKERHREYYYFGKYLREAVEVFGNYFGNNVQTTVFYHGISMVMYFANCYAKICGPTSTSYSKEIALNFAEMNGMVLRFRNEGAMTFCMDCEKFSCHSNEEEVLFIGGFAAIPFDSIFIVGTKNTYQEAVQIINILGKMMNGDKTPYFLKSKQIRSLKRIMNRQLGINGVFGDEFIADEYQSNLFKHFFQNVEFITFDMKLMKQHLVKAKRNTNWYGYEKLYTLFFDEELNMIKLHQLFRMCNNIKTIVIEKWKMNKYETNLGLCKKLINDIFSAILLSSYKFRLLTIALSTPLTEINDKCAAGHQLESFTTPKGNYSCDKCGDIFEKNTKMFGCFENRCNNHCNYSLCEICQKSKNIAAPILKETVKTYASKFNGWDVKLIKYENKAKRIADAISFYKL